MSTYIAEIEPSLKISQVFWDQKWLIITITFFVTLLTGIPIYKQKPLYEAKAIVAPPLIERASILHESSFIFLQSTQENNFNASELFTFFTTYSVNTSIRNSFYLQVYLPLFHPEVKKSLLENDFYKDYMRNFQILNYYTDMQKKIMIKVASESSIDAISTLYKYINFLNLKAYEQYNYIRVVRLKILSFELWQNINTLKKIETVSKKASLNSTFIPSIAPLLIELYQEKLNSLDIQLKSKKPISLFNYDSEITISNLTIESKLKKLLILGVPGGLILGFFAASLRIGIKSSKK